MDIKDVESELQKVQSELRSYRSFVNVLNGCTNGIVFIFSISLQELLYGFLLRIHN